MKTFKTPQDMLFEHFPVGEPVRLNFANEDWPSDLIFVPEDIVNQDGYHCLTFNSYNKVDELNVKIYSIQITCGAVEERKPVLKEEPCETTGARCHWVDVSHARGHNTQCTQCHRMRDWSKRE